MTTIAYHHKSKTIAVDGRLTCGGLIESDQYNKVHRNSAGIWIVAGELCYINDFINLTKGEKSEIKHNISGFLVADNKTYSVYLDSDCRLGVNLVEYNSADGSGRDFALTAMDFGADAVESVQHAMRRDAYTGGEIQVVGVTTGLVTRIDE